MSVALVAQERAAVAVAMQQQQQQQQQRRRRRRQLLQEQQELQELQARRKRPRVNSGYIGVNWSAAHSQWVAEMVVDGVYECLGYFSSKESAAWAYDLRAFQVAGDSTQLNFPLRIERLKQEAMRMATAAAAPFSALDDIGSPLPETTVAAAYPSPMAMLPSLSHHATTEQHYHASFRDEHHHQQQQHYHQHQHYSSGDAGNNTTTTSSSSSSSSTHRSTHGSGKISDAMLERAELMDSVLTSSSAPASLSTRGLRRSSAMFSVTPDRRRRKQLVKLMAMLKISTADLATTAGLERTQLTEWLGTGHGDPTGAIGLAALREARRRRDAAMEAAERRLRAMAERLVRGSRIGPNAMLEELGIDQIAIKLLLPGGRPGVLRDATARQDLAVLIDALLRRLRKEGKTGPARALEEQYQAALRLMATTADDSDDIGVPHPESSLVLPPLTSSSSSSSSSST